MKKKLAKYQSIINDLSQRGIFALVGDGNITIWDKQSGLDLGRYEVVSTTLFLRNHSPVHCSLQDMPGIITKLRRIERLRS